jgi:hypothetical protein
LPCKLPVVLGGAAFLFLRIKEFKNYFPARAAKKRVEAGATCKLKHRPGSLRSPWRYFL